MANPTTRVPEVGRTKSSCQRNQSRVGEVERPEAIGDDARVKCHGEEGGGGGGDGRQLGQVDPRGHLCVEIETRCEADKEEKKERVSVRLHLFFSGRLSQSNGCWWRPPLHK